MKKREKLIDEIIDDLLAYDPDTGVITWKVSQGRVAKGAVAGCRNESTGYWVIRVNRKLYRAHRLAYRLHFGNWPSGEIDHINRNKCDNRIDNLREATRHENAMNRNMQSNNTSGEPGVVWDKSSQKWQLRLTFDENSGQVYLGLYDTFEQACAKKRWVEYLFEAGNSVETIKDLCK